MPDGQFEVRFGNSIKGLKNGDQIFPEMLAAIRGAHYRVFLETYIYWSGDIAQEFASSLSECARRGVDTRVVLDDYGCKRLNQELIDEMEDAGVKIHRHRPVRLTDLRKSNHRSHRKLMIVDHSVGFIGGVGIADEWTGDAKDSSEWRDNHFRVEGPIVEDMLEVFLQHWPDQYSYHGTDEHPDSFPEDRGPVSARVVAAEPIRGVSGMADMFKEILSNAEKSVRICTPYFLPDFGMLKNLLKASKRGISVEVLTAGQHTDMSIVRSASRILWGKLLKSGIKIYEFEPSLIHVKSIIVDDKYVLIGSANFDVRSARLNDEACLWVSDADFASSENERFESDLSRSHPVSLDDWKDRTYWQRFLDRIAYMFRGLL